MSRSFVAIFSKSHDVIEATRECREQGFDIEDVYTPFPVHGLDDAMGISRSKITWVTFLAGLTGASIAMLGQLYVSWDYPLIFGGKPTGPGSIPAFIPITFELMVLIGGLSTVAAVLHLGRLFPGKKPKIVNDNISDDKFALEIKQSPGFDWDKAEEICNRHNADEVYEYRVVKASEQAAAQA